MSLDIFDDVQHDDIDDNDDDYGREQVFIIGEDGNFTPAYCRDYTKEHDGPNDKRILAKGIKFFDISGEEVKFTQGKIKQEFMRIGEVFPESALHKRCKALLALRVDGVCEQRYCEERMFKSDVYDPARDVHYEVIRASALHEEKHRFLYGSFKVYIINLGKLLTKKYWIEKGVKDIGPFESLSQIDYKFEGMSDDDVIKVMRELTSIMEPPGAERWIPERPFVKEGVAKKKEFIAKEEEYEY